MRKGLRKAKLLQEKLEVAEAGKAAAEADKAAFEARIFKKFHPLTQQITHLNAELEAKTVRNICETRIACPAQPSGH